MVKILQVFYGTDTLPYKDKARTTHFPIVGGAFLGAANTTEVRFYFDRIGDENATYVVSAKLPNGKVGYKLLEKIYDNELEEWYAKLNLSSFFTQFKGDLYLSLRSYQGGAEIIYDDEQDIYRVDGDPIILGTGSVKLNIAYAVPYQQGDAEEEVTFEDIYQELGKKLDVITDGIVTVVPDITSFANIQDYPVGTLFLDSTDGNFYIRIAASPYYEPYEIDYVHKKTTSGLFAYTHLGSTQSEMPISTPATGDTIAKRESDGRLKVATPSSDGDATTKKYVDDRVDKIIVVSGNTTLADPSILEEPNIRIYNSTSKFFYEKAYDRNSYYVFQCAYIGYKTDVNDYSRIVRHFCTAIKSTGVLEFADGSIIDTYDKSQTDSKFYNKTQVDNLLTTIKQNEIQVVSSLPSSGEEGIIYLVPINPQDLTKGYYRYIWENNAWLSLGTTEIDLSDYYNKQQTNTLLNNKVDKVGSPRKVYGTGDNGSQTVYGIDSDETGDGDIVRRESETNTVVVGTPTANNHATRKDYVDNLAATKVNKTNSANKVYGTDDTGAQTTFGYDDYVDGDFVRRDENGRIYAQNPVANGQVATKQYVDNSEQSAKDYADSQIATAVSRVYRYIGTLTVAQINALSTSSLTIGDVYNVSDSGTLTLGNVQVISGDNVAWSGTAWDKLANDINWEEYNEKFIAAGFFEVQDYDQSTGEITFVFATDLYDMSYDSNTGIMSIEAN